MTEQDLQAKIVKIVGEDLPPTEMRFDRDGKVIGFAYEKEWKEGGTETVEDKETGEITYKENYKQRKLTAAQCEKLDALAKDVNK